MIAPHFTHEPIRRHRTGRSARPRRVCHDVWIAAKLEIGQSVDLLGPAAFAMTCGSPPNWKSANP
jgi:hypothetical protein